MRDPLIGTDEAAVYLGVAASTLRSWRHHRRGPVWQPVGAAVRYRRSDLDRWLTEQRAGSRQPLAEK